MKNSLIVPIAIVAGGIIIALAVYLTVSGSASTALQDEGPSAVRPIDSSDHILGNPAARVMIVSYSDFDCPFCKSFDAVVRQAVNEYGAGGDVALAFRNFAITELHPNAKRHAEAAECVARAAGNDTYWRFTALLFANQPALPTSYAEYAQKAGASPEAVAACLKDTSTNGVGAHVDAERENAIRAGAHGTPYSLLLVPGKTAVVIEGAKSYDELKDLLDAALASAP